MIDAQAQVMFEPMSAAIEPIRSVKLRPLAVTTTTRAAALPDVPAIADAVPGYEASAVTGIGVPSRTLADIIATLNTAINAAFADPVMMARLADTGGIMLAGSPAEFGRLLAELEHAPVGVHRHETVGARVLDVREGDRRRGAPIAMPRKHLGEVEVGGAPLGHDDRGPPRRRRLRSGQVVQDLQPLVVSQEIDEVLAREGVPRHDAHAKATHRRRPQRQLSQAPLADRPSAQ
jgi:hypothetical protein